MILMLLLTTITTTTTNNSPPAPSRLRPTQLRTLLHSNLFKASLFTPSQEVPVSFKSFFMTSPHPRRGRPAFCLALDS